jgi:hypothetical protein
VNQPFATFKGSPAEQQRLVDVVLAKTPGIDSMTMFIAADTAFELGRLEDAAFLLYAARFRAMVDLERFSPKGQGGNSPGVYLAFLNANAHEVIGPAAIEKPAVLVAAAKRFAAWDFTTIRNYRPGWEYSGSPRAQESYKSKKDEVAHALTGQASLMQDAEYAGLLKSVNEFMKQYLAQMMQGTETTPAAQAQFRRAHARMVEIETAKGVRGYSTQFSPDVILRRDLQRQAGPFPTETGRNSAPAPGPRPTSTTPWPALSLQGVMGSGSNRECMINGQVVVAGGQIQGVRIVEIKSGAVVAEFQGERRVLNMLE